MMAYISILTTTSRGGCFSSTNLFFYYVLSLLLLREGIWLFVPDIGFHGFLLSLSAAMGRKQTCEVSDCLVLPAIFWRRRNNNSRTLKLQSAADAKGK